MRQLKSYVELERGPYNICKADCNSKSVDCRDESRV